MACNCATKEEIDKLYRLYGEKSKLPKKHSTWDFIKYYITNILVILLFIICFPLLLIYILALLFWRENERINISDIDLIKLFKIKP